MISRRDALRMRLAHGPPIVADGGMGSRLRQLGWVGRTEDANLHAPDVVEEIHRGFREAGAEMILTNTFTLPFRDRREYAASIEAAVARARAAARGAFVVGCVGPNVDWTPEAARECGRAFDRAGVDGVMLETITAGAAAKLEAKARAFLESFDGPRLTSHVPPAGSSPVSREPLGWNCAPPPDLLAALRNWQHAAARAWPLPPIVLRPSAGMPTGEGRGLTYPVTPAEFGAFAREAVALGARIIGGCCGSTPAHIAAIAEEVRKVPAG